MRFSAVVEFLKDMGHQPVVLQGREGRRQVVCAPSLVGRVMTSTLNGSRGDALGRVGVNAIRKGPVDPVFNDFGGEERFWFGPEGSQFGLHFTSTDQTLANYRVQAGMSCQPYEILSAPTELGFVTMHSRMELINCFGTHFEVDVLRTVTILEYCPYTLGYSDRLDFVGFQSESLITNVGDKPIAWETGVLSAWTIGQQPNGRRCAIVLPFQIGSDAELGELIRRDYIAHLCPGGHLPANRWRVGNDHVLIRTDGECRMKIGVGKRRARDRFGSIDLDECHLIINDFGFYREMEYVAPYWRNLSPRELVDGEAISVYVDGPDETGQPGGDFYELETLSPALCLLPKESFTHRNRVFHVRGELPMIGAVCQKFLGASLREVDQFLRG